MFFVVKRVPFFHKHRENDKRIICHANGGNLETLKTSSAVNTILQLHLWTKYTDTRLPADVGQPVRNKTVSGVEPSSSGGIRADNKDQHNNKAVSKLCIHLQTTVVRTRSYRSQCTFPLSVDL